MRIDRKTEESLRDMLGHAMRGELDEIPPILEAIGDQRSRECIGLCVLISGYTAVDVCGRVWPTSTNVRKIADNVAKASKDRLDLDADQVYEFLTQSALGFKTLDHVFPTLGDMTMLPILMTAAMIVTYGPREKDVWTYLDEVEDALEVAESLKPHVLPAMILQSRMPKAQNAG